MPVRAPTILWRMLFSDAAKVSLLTAGSLVVMMAFAAAVKPLADGKLEPGQALKFLLLALAPMLQFTLPFAAGFGATLAFHRFAADNEATAAHAGGISHRAMLAPAVALGVAFALVVGWLTHEAIPGYLRAMQRMIAQDIGKLISASVDAGRPLRLPDGLIVHADSVVRPPKDPASRAQDHLILNGVVAVRTGRDGAVVSEATAERAGVWLFPAASSESGGPRAPMGGTVVIRLIDASGSMLGEARGSSRDTEFRLPVPDAFRDDPKFYTWRGLRALRDHPDVIGAVGARRAKLASAMQALAVERAAEQAARIDGRLTLIDPDGQTLSMRVGALRRDGDRWALTAARAGAPIELVWRLSGDRARMQTAERAWIRVDAETDEAGPVIDLDLEEVATLDAASEIGAPTVRTRQRAGPFRLADGPEADAALRAATSAELLARAAAMPPDAKDERVDNAATALQDEIADLRREIRSKEQERLAATSACALMPLLGAVAALRNREGRPLLVYAWAFFPSLVALISIAGGQSLTHRIGDRGLLLLWGGVAALALFTLFEFNRLRKR